MWRTLAEQAEAAGNQEAAANWNQRCTADEEVLARAKVLQEAYIAPRAAAQAAMDRGDGAEAVAALEHVAFEQLPETQKDLADLYIRACRQEAVRLMDADNYAAAAAMLARTEGMTLPEDCADIPAALHTICRRLGLYLYESGDTTGALPYLLRARDDADVAPFFAEDTWWQLYGTWTCEGHSYCFNPDGTCIMDGTAMFWKLDGYNLWTGAEADRIRLTHKLAAVTDTQLAIRIVKTSGRDVDLTMERTGPCVLPPLP